MNLQDSILNPSKTLFPEGNASQTLGSSVMNPGASIGLASIDKPKDNKGIPGFAKGCGILKGPNLAQGSGILKGPGTTTSDSIPARLSKGEAVLNAGAAKKFAELLGGTSIEEFNALHAPKGASTSIENGVVHAAAGLDEFGNPKYPLLDWETQPPEALQSKLSNPDIQQTLANNNEIVRARQQASLNPAPKPAPEPTPSLQSKLSNPAIQESAYNQAEVMKDKGFGASKFDPEMSNPGRVTAPAKTVAPSAKPVTSDLWAEPKGISKMDTVTKNLKGLRPDPTAVYAMADAGNQALLESDIKKGDIGLGTVGRGIFSMASRAPGAIAKQVTGGVAEDSVAAKVGKWANTPIKFGGDATKETVAKTIPETVQPSAPVSKVGSVTYPTDGEGFVPYQTAERLSAENYKNARPQAQPLVEEQPKQGVVVSQGGIRKPLTENASGLRKDGSMQTLAWNESRFDNSGDAEKDAELAYRQGLRIQNAQALDSINAGLPAAALANVNSAAQNNTANRVVTADENNTRLREDRMDARTKANNETEISKANIIAAARAEQPKEFKPAFTEKQLSALPENATEQDRLRMSIIPKDVWYGFLKHVDAPDEKQGETTESVIEAMSKASGININVLKSRLYPTSSEL